MIVVEIQSPDDGRVSFEIGPFKDKATAGIWREWFLMRFPEFDDDFIEVRDVERKLFNPDDNGDMQYILDYYA